MARIIPSHRQQLAIITQTASRDGASSRYRCFQYIPGLEAAGFDVLTLSPIGRRNDYLYRAMASRRGIFRHLTKIHYVLVALVGSAFVAYAIWRKTDRQAIVMQQREQLPFPFFPFSEYVITHWLKRRLVFDFDDAIYLNNRYVALIWRWADQVIAGNEYLASEVRRNTSRPVAVIPTVVDGRAYTPRSVRGERRAVRIVWIGTPSTTKFLDFIRPILRDIQKRLPAVKIVLRTIGAHELDWPELSVEQVAWSRETEVKELRTGDIGIMPLELDAASEGKCSCKLVQYMALGMPTVATPTGANRAIVRQGVNGYLATRPDEWASYIEKLVDDRELRAKIGGAAARSIRKDLTVQAQLPRLVYALTGTKGVPTKNS